jgi:hypothetical protein
VFSAECVLYRMCSPAFFYGQKNSFYNFPNEKRRFRLFTTPLTFPLTSLTSGFRTNSQYVHNTPTHKHHPRNHTPDRTHKKTRPNPPSPMHLASAKLSVPCSSSSADSLTGGDALRRPVLTMCVCQVVVARSRAELHM